MINRRYIERFLYFLPFLLIRIGKIMALNENMATALASEKTLAKDWKSKEDEVAWKNL